MVSDCVGLMSFPFHLFIVPAPQHKHQVRIISVAYANFSIIAFLSIALWRKLLEG